MRKISLLVLTVTFLFLLSCSKTYDPTGLTPFQGIWSGEINTGDGNVFDLTLDVYEDSKTQKVLTSSDQYNFYYMEVDWKLDQDKLIFFMNDEEHRVTYELTLTEDDKLIGTYTQYGNTMDISFEKKSAKGKNGSFYRKVPEYTYNERLQQLKDYAKYEEDGVSIPFTYQLGQREEYESLIEQYELDTLTSGLTDLDLMNALLNWVCDHFKHNGSSGMPEERNANAIIEYYQENEGGINCRSVSIILAELLRVYQIPAKHITCMPKEAVFEDCHVVVHAYSEKLKQWVLLDPTYRLILQKEDGTYVNLPILRNMLLEGDKLIPNKNAGRNGSKFDVKDYSEYMTKNTFRFESATDFYYGAEDGYDGNVVNMLIPVGYDEDEKERTTTSDQAFWALPDM